MRPAPNDKNRSTPSEAVLGPRPDPATDPMMAAAARANARAQADLARLRRPCKCPAMTGSQWPDAAR